MKIFNPDLDRDHSIKRMVNSMVEIDTCYKNGLVHKGLGAVIIHRGRSLDYNPFDGWHRSKQITYQTIEELECFKNIPIEVTGIDEPAAWKNKNLIQLISEYGTDQVISAELYYDYLWFREPKTPNWRFFRVRLDAWSQPDVEAIAALFKYLANAVKL